MCAWKRGERWLGQCVRWAAQQGPQGCHDSRAARLMLGMSLARPLHAVQYMVSKRCGTLSPPPRNTQGAPLPLTHTRARTAAWGATPTTRTCRWPSRDRWECCSGCYPCCPAPFGCHPAPTRPPGTHRPPQHRQRRPLQAPRWGPPARWGAAAAAAGRCRETWRLRAGRAQGQGAAAWGFCPVPHSADTRKTSKQELAGPHSPGLAGTSETARTTKPDVRLGKLLRKTPSH